MTDISRSIIRLVNKIFATTEQFSAVSNQPSTILKKTTITKQTHECNPFSPLLPATLNISSEMTRLFPSTSLPTLLFIFAHLTTCHCHITATPAVLET